MHSSLTHLSTVSRGHMIHRSLHSVSELHFPVTKNKKKITKHRWTIMKKLLKKNNELTTNINYYEE